jgi:hypothetical protein
MIAVSDAGFIRSVRSLEFALDHSKLTCRGKRFMSLAERWALNKGKQSVYQEPHTDGTLLSQRY